MKYLPSIISTLLIVLLVPRIMKGGDLKGIYKSLAILFAFNLIIFCVPMETIDWPFSMINYAIKDTYFLLIPFVLYLITLVWILIKKKSEYSVLTFLLGAATLYYGLFHEFNSLHPTHGGSVISVSYFVVAYTLMFSPFVILLLYINLASTLRRRVKKS